jgi:hypothetical protein
VIITVITMEGRDVQASNLILLAGTNALIGLRHNLFLNKNEVSAQFGRVSFSFQLSTHPAAYSVNNLWPMKAY